MGQARHRKLNDPDYGKYSNRLRGLIVSNPIQVGADGSLSIISTAPDGQELRSSLLYWDRLAWPQNSFFELDNGPDVPELVKCGVMETPTINGEPKGTAAFIFTSAQDSAIDYYEKRSPGIWSLGAGQNSIVREGDIAGTGTALEIYNSLPVPGPDVPVVEILDFKERRRSELMIFRAHMDAMAKAITSSDDSGEALVKALKDLDLACADLISVTREWNFPVKLCNFKASVNFDFAKSASSAAKAWKAAEVLTLGKTGQLVAAAVAGVASNFKISADVELRSIKRPASPYKYLYHATKELAG